MGALVGTDRGRKEKSHDCKSTNIKEEITLDDYPTDVRGRGGGRKRNANKHKLGAPAAGYFKQEGKQSTTVTDNVFVPEATALRASNERDEVEHIEMVECLEIKMENEWPAFEVDSAGQADSRLIYEHFQGPKGSDSHKTESHSSDPRTSDPSSSHARTSSARSSSALSSSARNNSSRTNRPRNNDRRTSSQQTPIPEIIPQAKELTEQDLKNLPSSRISGKSNGEKQIRQYQCDICQRYLLSKRTLASHMKLIHRHESRGSFECDVCGKMLISKHSLKKHKETHMEAKSFICSYCGKGFRLKFNMLEHINSHTGQKPHKCTQCDKTFGRRTHLIVHMRIHTGAKPYKCTVEDCGRTYAHGIDLKRHLYGAHRIYTKKFECRICAKVYSENKLLTKHMKSHV